MAKTADEDIKVTREEALAAQLERRDKILEAALNHVMFDGWTMKALKHGAEDAGLSPSMAERAFPGGLREAVNHYGDWADRRMLARLEDMDLENMRIRDRVAAGVRVRLEDLTPYREASRRLVAYLALPGHQVLAAKMTWRTCDHIWYMAGDRATDFNHYTKRGLLAPVYTTTVLYWLNDTSDGFEETWGYLDRRISDVLKIPKYQAKAKKVLSKLPSPLRFARAMRG